MIRLLFIIAAALSLTACAGSYQFVDYRDRAYDPQGEYTLLDQIPNWDPGPDKLANKRRYDTTR